MRLVFEFFGLEFADKTLIYKVTEFLNSLVKSNDLELMRSYLWLDPIINIQSVNMALLACRAARMDFKSVWLPWLEAQASLILAIACITKEEDNALQHWLNYHDFILELNYFYIGKKTIVQLYDSRGLDFFLFHYLDGITNALTDSALFNNARVIPIALKTMGRIEEANLVAIEISARQKGLEEITSEFNGINFTEIEPNMSQMDKFRLLAERYWVNHISSMVWENLDFASRIDLIDAFIAEQLIKFQVLQSWTSVILPIGKIIERELGITFCSKWIDLIEQAKFKKSPKYSENSIRKRKKTFEILQQCASENKFPTLGQSIFVISFFNDEVMDDCTDLFKQIRHKLLAHCNNLDDVLFKLHNVLRISYIINGEQATVSDLRNASAHPSEENLYSWSEYLLPLKALFEVGQKGILNNIVIDLRIPLSTEN